MTILKYLGVLLVGLLIGYFVFLPHTGTNILGAPTGLSSVNLTPDPNADTYALAINGTPFFGTTGILTDFSVGFGTALSTSTTLTPTQFCAVQNQRWLGTTATATDTLPAATSTYAICGTTNFGGTIRGAITNDSTNTVNVVAGTNITFKCETQGVGTTTVSGGCTSSQISVNATSTANFQYYWDAASSSMVILWGNMFH